MPLTHDLTELVADGKRFILLTGCARSGTSIVGRYLASLDNFIYSYEPPSLMALLAEGENVTDDSFWNIWSTQVVMDSGVGSFTGRTLNLNRLEESSAHRFLTSEAIERRLGQTLRSSEALKLLRDRTVVVKIPDLAVELAKIARVLPRMVTIATVRHPASVALSLKERGWYPSPTLLDSGLALPVQEGPLGVVPYWLGEQDHEKWYLGSEYDRCLLNYIHTSDFTKIQPSIVFDFERMIQSGGTSLRLLAKKLGAQETSTSSSIRDSIHRGKAIAEFSEAADTTLIARALQIWRGVKRSTQGGNMDATEL